MGGAKDIGVAVTVVAGVVDIVVAFDGDAHVVVVDVGTVVVVDVVVVVVSVTVVGVVRHSYAFRIGSILPVCPLTIPFLISCAPPYDSMCSPGSAT